MDDTGISAVQKPGRVLGPKGQKHVGATISRERVDKVPALCSVSASGNYFPPAVTYPRKRMCPQLQKNDPVELFILVLKIGALLTKCS